METEGAATKEAEAEVAEAEASIEEKENRRSRRRRSRNRGKSLPTKTTINTAKNKRKETARRMGNGIRGKKRKQSRTQQLQRGEELHIPDTLEQHIEALMDEAGIIIEMAPKPTGTHNKDTTNNSRHQGNGRRKQCTRENPTATETRRRHNKSPRN